MTLATPSLSSDTSDSSRSVAARVVAVVVAHDGARWLPRALRALAGQTRPPDVVVAVDTGSTDGSADLLRCALGPEHVVDAPRRTGFGAAVALGLEHAATLADGPQPGDREWVWLLHDDCAPEPRALEHLVDTAAASSRIGVVGPKLVAWDDPTRLLEVGIAVSRGGRREDTLDGAVRDQGQHDGRSDVLAVGTAGLLARRDLWDELRGLDPALPLLRDDVDLCWRAHLAGRRVVVAPRAVVADAQAASRRLRPADAVRGAVRRADRRHGLHVALARCALWAVPLVLVQGIAQAVGRAVALLAGKAPGAALDELVAVGGVLWAPWRWMGSRWRARGTRTVPRASVSGLLVPRSAVPRRALDAVVGWSRSNAPADRSAAASEPGPTSDDAQPQPFAPAGWLRRLARAPLTWVLLAVVAVTVAAERALLGAVLHGRPLTGGALGRTSGSGLSLWQDALSTWRGPGLGTAGVAPPTDLLRAGVVRLLDPALGDRAATGAVALLVVGAPLLSVVTAYLAACSLTRSRAARAWAAAVWGVSPLLLTALSQGRLGPVVVHVLLPLVAAALARTLSARGSVAALCAAALGLALVGSVVPVTLVVGLGVAVGGVLLARGRARLRSAALVVLVPALLGPWVLELVRRPALVLAGPGAVDVGAPATGRAGVSGLLRLVEGVVDRPAGWSAWTLAVPFAPLLLAALLGVVRGAGERGREAAGEPRADGGGGGGGRGGGRRPGRAAAAAWAVALVATTGALVLPHVRLAAAAAGGAVPELRGWPGTVLDVVVLSVLGAALAGVARSGVARPGVARPGVARPGVARPGVARWGVVRRGVARAGGSGRGAAWRWALLAPVLLACALAPVGAAAGWVVRGVPGPLRDGPSTSPVTRLPAVAADAAAGPRGARTLVIGRTGGAVTYRLAGSEPDAWTLDLPPGPVSAAAAAVVPDAVHALLVPDAETAAGSATTEAARPDAVAALRRLAVGFVLVQEPVAASTSEHLDSLGSLTRIGAPRGARLWRVGEAQDPASARVQVLDARGTAVDAVPVSGGHATVDARVPAGPSGRRLVLSEVASSSWRATVDGRALAAAPAPGDWRQSFALPASGGHLVVRAVSPTTQMWHWAQLALVALLALLALPVRRPGAAT